MSLFGKKGQIKMRTPLKTVRAKCLDCSVTAHEVNHCQVFSCPLYPYRFGRRPTQEDIDTYLKACNEE